MKQAILRHLLLLLVCLLPAGYALAAQAAPSTTPPAQSANAGLLSPEQLEQLVAPIALYPDALFAQTLMAATYPLDVVAAARWLKANPNLSGADFDKALQQQPWDASVMALTKFPQVLTMMNEQLDWTEQLGNAFLAQPQDVMNAAQRLRAKARAEGNLESNQQQTVTVEPAAGPGQPQTIVIQPAQPDVVYVPTYNPTVVYGAWAYPAYPPMQWYPPGYAAAGAVISFGFGVLAGYAMWGDTDWYHGNVNINVTNYQNFTGRTINPNNTNVWQHNPARRGNVPYQGRVADRYRNPQTGKTPAQERAAAREAFRGHTPDGAGIARPGQGGAGIARPGQGGAGERDHRLGQDGGGVRNPEIARRADGERFDAQGGVQRPAQNIQRGTPQNRAFHNDGGPRAHQEFQRGEESRRVMQSHPTGGGVRERPQIRLPRP